MRVLLLLEERGRLLYFLLGDGLQGGRFLEDLGMLVCILEHLVDLVGAQMPMVVLCEVWGQQISDLDEQFFGGSVDGFEVLLLVFHIIISQSWYYVIECLPRR